MSRASALGRWDPGETSRSLDVYGGLRSPDVELLLDLLAETEGVAPAVRILTMLDQEFHLAWRAHRLQHVRAERWLLFKSTSLLLSLVYIFVYTYATVFCYC